MIELLSTSISEMHMQAGCAGAVIAQAASVMQLWSASKRLAMVSAVEPPFLTCAERSTATCGRMFVLGSSAGMAPQILPFEIDVIVMVPVREAATRCALSGA